VGGGGWGVQTGTFLGPRLRDKTILRLQEPSVGGDGLATLVVEGNLRALLAQVLAGLGPRPRPGNPVQVAR